MNTLDSQTAGAGRTLLIVDDQLGVRETLKYVLARAGYQVLCAETGQSAIALAASETIDAAMIDVHMPSMSGFEVCDRVRSQSEQSGTPFRIWLMTGAFSSEVGRRAHQCGTLGVFKKPFDIENLLAELAAGFLKPIPPSMPPAEPPSPTVRTIGDSVAWKGSKSTDVRR